MTVFEVSVICSPKGSGLLAGAGAGAGAAVEGKSPGDLVSAGGGAGVADGAGAGGVGACACTVAIPIKIAATEARAKRNKRRQFIRVFSLASFRPRALAWNVRDHASRARREPRCLTRRRAVRPMPDIYGYF